MPTINGSVSIAAGAENTNVLSGSIYEYVPFDALVEIALVDGAAGELRCGVTSGSDVLLEQGQVSNANRFPIYPDDFQLSDYAAAGDRLVIRARNTGAGANTLRYSVRMTPVS